MPGTIKNIGKLDVLEGDLLLSELSYVNDKNYPFKYTINRHYYSDNAILSSYICSDKELSFSLQAMNSYYDYVSVTPTSATNIKCFNTKMDVTEGKQLSISAKTNVTLVTKDTDVKIRNSLTGIDMTIEKIGIWDNKIYEKPTFHYSINVADGVNYKIFEKINNETIKEIIKNNPSENVFDIDSWDTMKYGIYNISIDIMIDDILKCNLSHNLEKLKSPVQLIPTNSNLKQVMLHNKELEKEISYQNFRLSEKLKEKGVEVGETHKMSSLIDKINNIIAISKFTVGDDWKCYSSNGGQSLGDTYTKIGSFEIFTDGGFRGFITARSKAGWVKITHMRSESEVFSKEIRVDGSTNILCKADIDDVKKNDIIEIWLKASSSTYPVFAYDFGVSCNISIL